MIYFLRQLSPIADVGLKKGSLYSLLLITGDPDHPDTIREAYKIHFSLVENFIPLTY